MGLIEETGNFWTMEIAVLVRVQLVLRRPAGAPDQRT